MPTSEEPLPAQLKDWFDEKRHRSLAHELGMISDSFRAGDFLRLTLEGLPQRTLMQRLHQCALAVDAAMEGTFQQKVRVLKQLAPRIGHSFVCIFLCDFVATFGRHHFTYSMDALRYFTPFGSAEFAVRGFIAANPQRALSLMQTWAADADEHVRRLASEGSRPRLPWGMKLSALVQNPALSATILEALKEDDSLYVRRSVANHLNDITKDHPEWVLERLEAWDLNRRHLRWIARHACRTLIKRGHPRALKLFGFGDKTHVEASLLTTPARLKLGGKLSLEASIHSTSKKAQSLAVDYVIHYVKARGVVYEKVFKWTEVELPAFGSITLSRSQTIRDFTTRKHHAGYHVIELQVNGRRLARAGFDLVK
jgi:3-methyladenine DNA glycosylase AlkC